MDNPKILLSSFQMGIKSKVNRLMYSINEQVLEEHFTLNKIKETNISSVEYFEKLDESNWQDIREQYLVMDDIFELQKKNLEDLFYKITKSFYKDKFFLQEKGIIHNQCIQDVNIGEGDQHNGKSTAVLTFINNQKLIFKPTNAAISCSYFGFLDWINQYFDMGNYFHQIYNEKKYHWQEFVIEKNCSSTEELKTYYLRAGYLLGILYVINGSDYHAQNLIAHGNTPVLIDHETVIQPKISTRFDEYFTQFNKELKDTVLNTFLLPNKEAEDANSPVGICGLGYSKETKSYKDKKVGINRFTKYWRIVTKLIVEDYVKCNVPTLNGKKVFVEEYSQDFLKGFDECYQLLLKNKEFLLSKASPVQHFKNIPVRYIWRSTAVYDKIIDFMRQPKNLKDKELFKNKIKYYLSIAYKNVPSGSELRLIIEHEVAQILRGDIPFFEVNSSSRDLETEFGTIKDFFELSAVENIQRKLKKLSLEDLEFQKNLIIESIK